MVLMINKDNCILLGTLAKPHGTKGSLQLRYSGLKAEDIKERGLVFVEIDGLPVPFFIESFQDKTDDMAILKIEGVDSETKAREFAGFQVYVMKNQVKHKSGNVKELPGFKGYRVIDRHLGFVGYASEIVNTTTNPLLLVILEGKEYLIPVHEDIILDFDDKEKLIRVDAPEGLFDL
jgi:16S rRNA processing protein RimM